MPTFQQLEQPRVDFVQSNVKGMGGFVLYRHGAAAVEHPGFRGMSHLGEHLFARSYMRFGDEIANLGLDLNASTYGHKIEFHAFGLESSVLEFVERILLHEDKYVLRHVPSREDFERERNVVIQEYEGFLSRPEPALWVNVARKHFNYSGSIGMLTDLRGITYEDFLGFYDTTFRQFTGIAYVGDVEHAKRQPWAAPEFWAVPGRESERQYMQTIAPTLQRLPDPNPGYVGEFFGGSDRETFIMDWIEFDALEWERKIVQELWNCGTVDSSPLMVELRKKRGLCYAAGIDADFRPVGILSTYITTAPENVEQVRDVTRDVLRNHQDHITPERYRTTMAYVRKVLEKASLLNFEMDWLSRFYSQEDSVLTMERLESFTYDRCLELHEQFRARTWMRAEAGKDLILD